MKVYYKAENSNGDIIRDKMTRKEWENFMTVNNKNKTKYKHTCYEVKTYKDKIINVLQWLFIAVLCLTFTYFMDGLCNYLGELGY